MPKINIYLPDELAEAVREADIPVSAVCQRALEQAVRRVAAVRETVTSEIDIDDPAGHLAHFTARARTALKLTGEQARAAGSETVGTEHLLGGLLAEGENLALQVLKALEIEPDRVREELSAPARPSTPVPSPAPTSTPASAPASASEEQPPADAETPRLHFGEHAAEALRLTVTEATTLGHNYIGCEHLLLGLVTEPEGTAGRILRTLGAEPRLTRRAVAAALAGYVHLRAQTQHTLTDPTAALTTAVQQQLQPLTARIAHLESHVGLGPTP